MGSTCMHKIYHVSFAFLANKTEESYFWALLQLRTLFQEGQTSDVMIMDYDLALLNAVAWVFPWCHYQICIWHVEKNVFLHASPVFSETEELNQFMKTWTSLIATTSTNTYEQQWKAFKQQYSNYSSLLNYLDTT